MLDRQKQRKLAAREPHSHPEDDGTFSKSFITQRELGRTVKASVSREDRVRKPNLFISDGISLSFLFFKGDSANGSRISPHRLGGQRRRNHRFGRFFLVALTCKVAV